MSLPIKLIVPTPAPERTLGPTLKWAGGKRWLLPELRVIFEPFRKRRLVEPFVGGIAVALGLSPQKALLADINPHLINLYRWLKLGLEIDFPLTNRRSSFLAARRRFNYLVTTGQERSAEAAGLFYYLNRTCFNGLCRFNQSGEFNVPFGQYSKINYCTDFSGYKKRLHHWEFAESDFETLKIRKNDFLYIDPPYDVQFTTYSKGGFDWSDQVRLVEWLTKHRCPIVASNQATPRILKLYKQHGFTIRKLSAPRRISCTGNRTPAMEMLATKNI